MRVSHAQLHSPVAQRPIMASPARTVCMWERLSAARERFSIKSTTYRSRRAEKQNKQENARPLPSHAAFCAQPKGVLDWFWYTRWAALSGQFNVTQSETHLKTANEHKKRRYTRSWCVWTFSNHGNKNIGEQVNRGERHGSPPKRRSLHACSQKSSLHAKWVRTKAPGIKTGKWSGVKTVSGSLVHNYTRCAVDVISWNCRCVRGAVN